MFFTLQQCYKNVTRCILQHLRGTVNAKKEIFLNFKEYKFIQQQNITYLLEKQQKNRYNEDNKRRKGMIQCHLVKPLGILEQ